ncbi:histidinol-phosphatase HisJ family protein [Halalkalibacter alkaliphilus]|uniref:Histidinol-phosphatase n=1 Tax=Halalkalibacter alkaliphilus TaxID=2917993 RepID=A0A9X2CR84_9BACI|nr:histidinol-phosphatase HisJ family protein [Halalkalibacter alkaliphilus]MCL7745545.1 histidinol-phosphatase HisJ family protein [Halalkalibacter alkaliphilus]
MYFLDFHNHTNHSFDSQAVMEEVCKVAIGKGLNEICFTEHYSLNPKAPTYGHIDLNNYLSDLNSCQLKFQGEIKIKKGIEICEPHLLKEHYSKTLKPLELDVILGSVHNISNNKLRKRLEVQQEKAYMEYFQEVYEMVKEADIDIVAHLDLMKRYAHKVYGTYDFIEHREMIEIILSKIIDRNIGIEINTSGLRTSLNETLPSIDVIRLYKKLGGEILTIGSDSHEPDSIGSYVKEGIKLAKEFGFNYIFSFEKRKPIPIKI